uniref:Uncharacterized protein n=1 Tax=Arundo donax TaxID=35708 RepID=A0A0A8YAV8_ARUDO
MLCLAFSIPTFPSCDAARQEKPQKRFTGYAKWASIRPLAFGFFPPASCNWRRSPERAFTPRLSYLLSGSKQRCNDL